jgi:hypothetical protein
MQKKLKVEKTKGREIPVYNPSSSTLVIIYSPRCYNQHERASPTDKLGCI